MEIGGNCIANQRAFSLIEIVFALAIFTTGLVVLSGMLPQNLDNMRRSSARSMERRIAQNIIGELMLNDWEKIHLFGEKKGQRRFYDAQGIELKEFSVDAIFTARVSAVPRDVNIDQDRTLESIELSEDQNHSLPDDEKIEKSTSQHARRILVEVTDKSDENFDFDDPENQSFILRVGTVIANLNEVILK